MIKILYCPFFNSSWIPFKSFLTSFLNRRFSTFFNYTCKTKRFIDPLYFIWHSDNNFFWLFIWSYYFPIIYYFYTIIQVLPLSMWNWVPSKFSFWSLIQKVLHINCTSWVHYIRCFRFHFHISLHYSLNSSKYFTIFIILSNISPFWFLDYFVFKNF